VPGAGKGQPLVEPDGLISVGPRSLQRGDQIDIGHASGAEVRPRRVREPGTDPRVVGGGGPARMKEGS
jgi:hypothetical protein